MTKLELQIAMMSVSFQRIDVIEENEKLADAGHYEEAALLIPKINELDELFVDLYKRLNKGA